VITAIYHNLSDAFDVDLLYYETRAWASMALIVVDNFEVRYERF